MKDERHSSMSAPGLEAVLAESELCARLIDRLAGRLQAEREGPPVQEDEARHSPAGTASVDEMGDNRPLVSVTIPTYNRARLVVEAVESVLAQTYSRLEVIVVDDGSTDDTPQALRLFARDERFTCLRRPENRGRSHARNVGLERAKGEYLAFLDSDDRWDASYLETMIGYLEAHPEVDLAWAFIRFYAVQTDETGRIVRKKPLYYPHADRIAQIYNRAQPPRIWLGPTHVVLRATLEPRFDERIEGPEDADLWQRLREDGARFGNVPFFLCEHRTFVALASPPAL